MTITSTGEWFDEVCESFCFNGFGGGCFFCTLPKTKMFSEQMVVCSDKPFHLRNGRPPSDGYIISPGLGVGKLDLFS